MTNKSLERLYERLNSIPSGKLGDTDSKYIMAMLASCWNDLRGSQQSGMKSYKLIDRIDELHWNDPLLTFQIERHGAINLGSKRAELQTWEIDVKCGTARSARCGSRLLKPMDRPLDVKSLAAELAAVIVGAKNDDRIKWLVYATRVEIRMTAVIPGTNKRTTASRRMRFTGELEELLTPQGWRRIKAGSHLIFERTLAMHSM